MKHLLIFIGPLTFVNIINITASWRTDQQREIVHVDRSPGSTSTIRVTLNNTPF